MEKIKGRPMHEVRRLVAEDNARWYQLGEVWQELTEDEQVQLIIIAQSMAARS